MLIAAALLALGFGAGLYASDRVEDEPRPAERSAAQAPVRAETAPVAPPAETQPPVTTTAPASEPEPAVPEPQPEFSVAPLSPTHRAQLRKGGFWRPGCPVSLDGLRAVTVSYQGFDGRMHTGELIVNGEAAHPLRRVFRRLYEIRFPVRHIGFAKFYGPRRDRPKEGDVTASFECRQSVPSPCTGGTSSGRWSNHAYGLAIDINPTENPYIGCGQSRDPATKPYRDRTRQRRGMIGPRVISAFASVGWEWGGSWAGDTKDYMHFSVNGH